jgi:hypothetical protein
MPSGVHPLDPVPSPGLGCRCEQRDKQGTGRQCLGMKVVWRSPSLAVLAGKNPTSPPSVASCIFAWFAGSSPVVCHLVDGLTGGCDSLTGRRRQRCPMISSLSLRLGLSAMSVSLVELSPTLPRSLPSIRGLCVATTRITATIRCVFRVCSSVSNPGCSPLQLAFIPTIGSRPDKGSDVLEVGGAPFLKRFRFPTGSRYSSPFSYPKTNGLGLAEVEPQATTP